jgi:hypothetical protein
MNIFRLAGDMCHVFSIIVLLLRLRVAKNAQGKTCHGSYVGVTSHFECCSRSKIALLTLLL